MKCNHAIAIEPFTIQTRGIHVEVCAHSIFLFRDEGPLLVVVTFLKQSPQKLVYCPTRKRARRGGGGGGGKRGEVEEME